MKNLVLVLMVVVAMTLNNQTIAQSSVKEVGINKVESIIKIKVIDDYNSRPIRNAVVKFTIDSRRVFEIRTNQEGIAVIVKKFARGLSSGKLSIRDRDYKYSSWSQNLNWWDYETSHMDGYKFVVSLDNGDINTWRDQRGVQMSGNQILRKITNENYQRRSVKRSYTVHKGNRSYNIEKAPMFYEINARLIYKGRSSSRNHNNSNSENNYNRNESNNYNQSNLNNNSNSISNPKISNEYEIEGYLVDNIDGWKLEKKTRHEIVFINVKSGTKVIVKESNYYWNVHRITRDHKKSAALNPFKTSLENALKRAAEVMRYLGDE